MLSRTRPRFFSSGSGSWLRIGDASSGYVLFCAAGKKRRDAPARYILPDALLQERREWVTTERGEWEMERLPARLRYVTRVCHVTYVVAHTGRVRDVHDTL